MRQIETAVQILLSRQVSRQGDLQPENLIFNFEKNPVAALVAHWLNRGLGSDRRVELRIGWPLWLIPVVALNQLVAPHTVWVVLLVALCGFYVVGYVWVRNQTPSISCARRRIGSILVAGDLLQEEFEVRNQSSLPLLWAEFIDESNVPGYIVGRIVACEGDNVYRWRTEVLCKQRGMFRLGPHHLRFQDPFGLFAVTVVNRHEDIVLIYPRVVHLPVLQLPRGNSQGGDRQRRPILGNLPAATISEYQQGDSLRHVHWASTARRGRMMVKDLEIEPSGNIWLVADLDRRVHEGEGLRGTLEHCIVVTASLAAELLSGRDQRAVGLLAFSGSNAGDEDGDLVQVMPGVGSAHVWPILSALAPVREGDLGVAALLASSRDRIDRRSTLTVVTSLKGGTALMSGDFEGGMARDWVAELVHLRGVGVESSVILIAAAEADVRAGDAIQALLARMAIPCSVVVAGAPLPALLTFRRSRRVVRTTPTGGVVSYDVDEEVG